MTKNNINVDIEEKIVQLEAELAEVQTQLAEMEGNWKRALADYKNLQKRGEEEKTAILRFANMTLLEAILPVLDNMELLDKHSGDQGLALTVKDFKQVLQSIGLEEFDVSDKDFDETTMEAVDMVDGEKNKVVEVLKKGYLFKDKIIRPAYVKVGKGE